MRQLTRNSVHDQIEASKHRSDDKIETNKDGVFTEQFNTVVADDASHSEGDECAAFARLRNNSLLSHRYEDNV